MALPVTFPSYNLRVRGDVLIVLLHYPSTFEDALAHQRALLDHISSSGELHEPGYNYICLLGQPIGASRKLGYTYRGFIPESGQVGFEWQPYVLTDFVENDEERAIKKVLHAYDKGPDTNPYL
jgi:hypothetical protein